MGAWEDHSSCAKADNPDLWDMDIATSSERQQAVDICRTCPVIAQCFDESMRKPPFRMIQAGYGWKSPSSIPFDPVRRRMPPTAPAEPITAPQTAAAA